MVATQQRQLGRAEFLAKGGALVVAFALPSVFSSSPARAHSRRGPAQEWPAEVPPGRLDSWLAVAEDGSVTARTGKVELGTGTRTALAQIVAEELGVPFERVKLVMGDTARTVNQGTTAGSKTLQNAGPHLHRAAAEARRFLVDRAAQQLNVDAQSLSVRDGVVRGSGQEVSYGELIGGERFEVELDASAESFDLQLAGDAPLKSPNSFTVVGQPIDRVDIPAKVVGDYTYIQDVRVDGMVHGRVVRPPRHGAKLRGVDRESVQGMPGLVQVVSKGDFVGVVAEREEQAIAIAEALQVQWSDPEPLPAMNEQWDAIRESPIGENLVARSNGDANAGIARGAQRVQAEYRWPWQMHASIGPSCAVADLGPRGGTVWSGTQSAHDLRVALGELLSVPVERLRVIQVEASGCYGHNGADDVAGDAALLSHELGRPVRVQWMREDEHGWEPKGPAMVIDTRAGLAGDGTITGWNYEVWTPTHSTRPGGMAGNLWAGLLTGVSPPEASYTGGDRNAPSSYALADERVVAHFIDRPAFRPSALRCLGGVANCFANESFVDELAAAANADPVEYRLRHLRDPRLRRVLEAAAEKAGWEPRPAGGNRGGGTAQGRGVAISQYENEYAYVATVVEVDVERQSGNVHLRRAVVAHDCGRIVNPDGLRNQLEGNVIQSASRALKEEVTFDRTEVTSLDWSSYSIMTFDEIPDAVEMVLIDRPDQPMLGAGEPASETTPPAIANAIFDATGARIRQVPMTPKRVQAAIGRV